MLKLKRGLISRSSVYYSTEAGSSPAAKVMLGVTASLTKISPVGDSVRIWLGLAGSAALCRLGSLVGLDMLAGSYNARLASAKISKTPKILRECIIVIPSI